MIEEIPGGTSLRARTLHAMSRMFVWTPLSRWPMQGPSARLMFLADAVFRPVPRLRGTSHEKVRAGPWSAELVTAGTPSDDGAILYMHGGAFLFCGVNSHRRVVERLAVSTGLPVLSVDYRQLPQGLYDDTLADCTEAFEWLLDRGFDPRRVVLAGDSAGGHLAFALAHRLYAAGAGRVAGIAAFSPWLDFHGAVGPDASLSPVYGDLSGLPPVLMTCAADEVFRGDAELMAARLQVGGQPYLLTIWHGMVHAFPVLAHTLPESRLALDLTAEFVRDCLAEPAHGAFEVA